MKPGSMWAIALAAIFFAGPVAAQDVESVEQLVAAAQRHASLLDPSQADRADIVAVFARVLDRECDAALRDSGVASLSEKERNELSSLVKSRVESEFGRAPAKSQEELDGLIRRLSSRALALSVVHRFFGQTEPAAPPAPPLEPASGLSRQLGIVESQQSPLRLVKESVRVLEEVGGAGAGNGLLDAGEWVRLSTQIRNQSDRAWFSSSTWVESAHPCVWTDATREHQMAELPPGSTGDVAFWVFLSEECKSPDPLVISLRVRDSLHTGNSGVRLFLTVTPVRVPAPRLVNLRLDTDLPGSSDGSRKEQLGPEMRFEISTDVEAASPDIVGVQTAYSFPFDVKHLFSELSYRPEPLTRAGAKLFLASDDLDGQTASRDAFHATLSKAPVSRHWALRGSRLWLQVETVLFIGKTNEPSSTSAPAPLVQLSPPSARALIELVRMNLSLEARSTPATNGGIAAVDGYELMFDEALFSSAYERLLSPTPPALKETSAPAPFAYRFSHFVPLPVVRPEVFVASASSPAPQRVAAAPQEMASPSDPWVRLDLGAGWTRYGVSTPPLWDGYWSGETNVHLTPLAGRITLGKKLVGIAGARYGWTSREPPAVVEFFAELSLQAGGGWVFSRTRGGLRSELMPYALVEYRRRRLVADMNFTTHGIAVAAGATGRLWFHEHVGVFLDAGLRVGSDSPLYAETELVAGRSLEALAGLTLSW